MPTDKSANKYNKIPYVLYIIKYCPTIGCQARLSLRRERAGKKQKFYGIGSAIKGAKSIGLCM
jgi:hypothetical protein